MLRVCWYDNEIISELLSLPEETMPRGVLFVRVRVSFFYSNSQFCSKIIGKSFEIWSKKESFIICKKIKLSKSTLYKCSSWKLSQHLPALLCEVFQPVPSLEIKWNIYLKSWPSFKQTPSWFLLEQSNAFSGARLCLNKNNAWILPEHLFTVFIFFCFCFPQ